MLRAVVVPIAAITLIACGKSPSKLIGAWVYDSQTTVGNVTMNSHTEDIFYADGRYLSITRTTPQKPSELAITATDTGHWTLEDDNKLTVNVEDVAWEFSGDSEENRKRAKERFKENKASIIQNANSVNPVIITWISDDAFKYLGNGKEFVERRKK